VVLVPNRKTEVRNQRISPITTNIYLLGSPPIAVLGYSSTNMKNKTKTQHPYKNTLRDIRRKGKKLLETLKHLKNYSYKT
jgi:hypothetical protein